jgi:uncharacterized protein YkwD
MLGVLRKKEAFLLAVNPLTHATGRIGLTRSGSSVGNEPSNDVVIHDSTVSRCHAVIRRRHGKWQVKDNRSTNGTYVKGQNAGHWTTMHDGEEVRFGGASFVFRSRPVSAARITSGFRRPRKRAAGLRAIIVVIAAGLVGGFAATQYFLFRSYQQRVDSPPADSPRATPAGQKLAQAAPPRGHSRTSATQSGALSTTLASLERVNYWRALENLAPVSSTPDLNGAALKHARYLVKHALEGKLAELAAGGAHTEDPSDEWYTPDGLAAGENSDVSPPCRGCPLRSASQEIDDLIAVPFHRFPILDPQIKRLGYGSYSEGGYQAAVLYLPISPRGPTTFEQPIEFPPNGSTVGLAVYEPEWPDPLSSCTNYDPPAGSPITIELGSWLTTQVTSYSVKTEDQTLDSCIFNDATYNSPNAGETLRAHDALRAYGAVALIPRQPLTSGRTYSVSYGKRQNIRVVVCRTVESWVRNGY